LEHLRQLSFEQLEFGDLLPDGAQLLRHKGMQVGTHRQTLPTVKLCRQRFERGKRKPEGTRAANEQEPMHIVAGVVPIPCATPAWHRQHPDLLVIANGLCWYAGGARELANGQGLFHGCSSLCDRSRKKGTHSSDWKVKGWQVKKLLRSRICMKYSWKYRLIGGSDRASVLQAVQCEGKPLHTQFGY
jgi:hypothetical protein